MNHKIGPDLREFSETVFFGLNLRQLISSLVGIALSVTLWLTLGERLGQQYTSWLCCAAVAPCACIGFIKVQGQSFERFAVSWIKYRFFESHKLRYRSNDINALLLAKRLNTVVKERKGGDADENAENVRKAG